MSTVVVVIVQVLCAALVLSGGLLCLFGRDRRDGRRRPLAREQRARRRSDQAAPSATVIELADASHDRATDFEIGYRRARQALKRAA